jgi:hypothetical protein
VTALLLAALAALPDHAAQRYRMEIGGAAVGVATLTVRCERATCTAVFETATRLPEAGGNAVQERRVEVETDRAGTALTRRGAGGWRRLAGDRVASILAEVLLAGTPEGERRCLEVEDVESGRAGRACATRRGTWLTGEILGEPVRFRPGPGGLPEEVLLVAQGARFAADARAAVPARAPDAFGVEVPAPPGAEAATDLTFCGLDPEPQDPAPPPAGLPRDFPERGHCREDAAEYLREARAEGLAGRHVVGVAWDGRRFVWHEWVEVAAGNRWVAVDPSFRQIPAQPPRFAVARFADGEGGDRAEAGRRVLRCWGRARIQRGARAAPPAVSP